MNIPMDFSNDQIAILDRAFGLERFKTHEDLALALLPLAVGAWLSWLSGEKRYNSLTEQYTDWFEKIYEDLLPPAEVPSVERLLNSFNVPYGQAQYIARVLKNRDTPRWRKEALDKLKAALSDQKDKTKVYTWPRERAKDFVEIKLFKAAARELEIIMGDLFHVSSGEVDIPRRSGWGDMVTVNITARTFKKVCERLGITE